MPFKTVLSVVGLDHPSDDFIKAINLCAGIDAHLSLLVMGLAAPPPIMEYAATASDPWMKERRDDSARLDRRVEEIVAAVSKAAISFEIDHAYVDLTWVHDVIGSHARLADLTVVGGNLLGDGVLGEATLKGALFESACPVLVVPKGLAATLRPKSIVLGWDSHLHAARAAHEAIELMVTAERVHVTLVDPDANSGVDGLEPGTAVAAWLARHGINVSVDRLPSGGRTIAEALWHHAADVAADLLVVGAYSRSPLRERVFGGVTKALIDQDTVPLLMAH